MSQDCVAARDGCFDAAWDDWIECTLECYELHNLCLMWYDDAIL